MTGIDLTVGGLTRDRDVQSMVGNLVDPPNIVPAVGPQISVHSLLFSYGPGFLSERSDLLGELQVEGTPETTVHANFRLPGNFGKVTKVELTLPQEAKALIVSVDGARGVLTDLPRELTITIGSSFAWFRHSGTSLDGTMKLGASTVSFQDLPQEVRIDWYRKGFWGDCGSYDLKPVIDVSTSRAPWGMDLEVEIVQDTLTTTASAKNLERLGLDLDLAEKAYRVEMEFVQQTGEASFDIDGVEHDEKCRPRSMESSVVGTELGEANLGVQDREPELSMGAHLGPRGRFVAMMAIEFFGWDTIPEAGLDRQAGSDCLVQNSYRILLPFRLDACLLEGQCNTYTLPTHLVGMCALEAS